MGLAVSKSAFKIQNKIIYSTVPQILSNSQLKEVTNQTRNQDLQDCKDLFFCSPVSPKWLREVSEALVLNLLSVDPWCQILRVLRMVIKKRMLIVSRYGSAQGNF